MTTSPITDKLDSDAAVARHLEALLVRDPRLAPVSAAAGPVLPRRTTAGFAGMARIVCGQQLSVASASAIWARLEALEGALEPRGFLALDDAALRAAGLSAGKCSTLRVVAEAAAEGWLDFAHVETLEAEAAIAALTAHKGIGPWTAEIYLMFCAGHPDIFPAGDLALQKAVAHGLGLDARPSIKQLTGMARDWAPHRAAAALLFWRYYAAIREKEGIML